MQWTGIAVPINSLDFIFYDGVFNNWQEYVKFLYNAEFFGDTLDWGMSYNEFEKSFLTKIRFSGLTSDKGGGTNLNFEYESEEASGKVFRYGHTRYTDIGSILSSNGYGLFDTFIPGHEEVHILATRSQTGLFVSEMRNQGVKLGKEYDKDRLTQDQEETLANLGGFTSLQKNWPNFSISMLSDYKHDDNFEIARELYNSKSLHNKS